MFELYLQQISLRFLISAHQYGPLQRSFHENLVFLCEWHLQSNQRRPEDSQSSDDSQDICFFEARKVEGQVWVMSRAGGSSLRAGVIELAEASMTLEEDVHALDALTHFSVQCFNKK